jgi:UTP--glucose-1-phosphate uridylyltransferase
MGRYIINSGIFDVLEKTKPGKGGEIQLTDGLKNLCKTQDTYAYIFDGIRYDVGNTLGYMIANTDFALEQKEIGKDFESILQIYSIRIHHQMTNAYKMAASKIF